MEKKVWIGYGKIRIDEQWWRWDEAEVLLRDGRGNIRRERKGEGEEGENREGRVEKRGGEGTWCFGT